MGYLTGRHDAVLAAAGGGKKVYSYGYVFNGFAAELTDAQADKLRSMPGVLSVEKDELVRRRHLVDAGLPRSRRAGRSLGAARRRGQRGREHHHRHHRLRRLAGEPELLRPHRRQRQREQGRQAGLPADSGLARQVHAGRAVQRVELQPEADRRAATSTRAGAATRASTAQRPWEFNSPRDYNGHGTHTVVDRGRQPQRAGDRARRACSARSAAWRRARGSRRTRRCWSTQDTATASGFASDLVAAIDQAVADGVDVINYSISGSPTNFRRLRSRSRSCSPPTRACSSRPRPATAARRPAPSRTRARGSRRSPPARTIATARAPSRSATARPTPAPRSPPRRRLGAAHRFDGRRSCPAPDADGGWRCCFTARRQRWRRRCSIRPRWPARSCSAIAASTRASTRAARCKEAGGVGMVLVNTTRQLAQRRLPLRPDRARATRTARPRSRPIAATAGATATINAVDDRLRRAGAVHGGVLVARSAARGRRRPAEARRDRPGPGHPGGVSRRRSTRPATSTCISGTSMSSPHVAGLAALLMDLPPELVADDDQVGADDLGDRHPRRTGVTRRIPLVIFRQGAGHVRPNRAADPGLVYNHGFNDWLAFLCGTTTAVGPATCSALQASAIRSTRAT